jgi:hypothetical protein
MQKKLIAIWGGIFKNTTAIPLRLGEKLAKKC